MTDLCTARPLRGAQGVAVPPVMARAVLRFGLGLALSATALPAVAQTAPPTVQPPTREELQRGVAEGTLNMAAPPQPVDTGEVERAPCPLAAPEFSDIRLKLSSVTFSGLEAIPGEDLSGTWAEYVGTDQPVAVICEIRDRAATQLRNAGYLAAVQVPPQKIAGGEVRLDVLAARMTRIQVKGEAGASEGLLVRYLDKLTEEPVFNTFRAERYLLLARDIPGLDVRLALRPIEGSPGEVVGEISVRRTPIFADLTLQNYGSKAIGRESGLVRLQFNGLTGLGDATSISFFSTADFDEQKVIQVGHEMRLGAEGFVVRGDFTYGKSRPTVTGNAPFKSETIVASLEGAYPFIRRQSLNLYGTVGLDVIDQDIDFGAIPLNRDRIRVLYARVDVGGVSKRSLTGRDGFTPLEPRMRWGLSLEARQGVGLFGATKGCAANVGACLVQGTVTPTRIEGTAKGFIVRAGGVIEYRPKREVTFSLEPRVQYSPDALLSYEEFSAGNYTVGRGYDPGAIIGDSGVGVRSEVRFGSLIPETPGANAWQPYAFFDAAWVWNHDSAFAGLNPQKLYSAGAGVRGTLKEAIRVDGTVAVPLRDVPGQAVKGDVRFLVNLSVQLAPWRF